MKTRMWIGILAASLLLIGLPAAAQVAPASDCLTVFGPTGTILFQVCATEADEEVSGADHIYVINANIVNPDQFGFPTILLDPDNETVSDIFGIAGNGVPGCDFSLCLAFASDTDTASPFFPGEALTLPESLGVFDATSYLAPSLLFTAQFTSDSNVPEPTTMALLGLGILALGFARRKSVGPIAR